MLLYQHKLIKLKKGKLTLQLNVLYICSLTSKTGQDISIDSIQLARMEDTLAMCCITLSQASQVLVFCCLLFFSNCDAFLGGVSQQLGQLCVWHGLIKVNWVYQKVLHSSGPGAEFKYQQAQEVNVYWGRKYLHLLVRVNWRRPECIFGLGGQAVGCGGGGGRRHASSKCKQVSI